MGTYIDELKKAYVEGVLMDSCGVADRVHTWGSHEDYCNYDLELYQEQLRQNSIFSTTTTTESPYGTTRVYYGVYKYNNIEDLNNEDFDEIFEKIDAKDDVFYTAEFVTPTDTAHTDEEIAAMTTEEFNSYCDEYAYCATFVLPVTTRSYLILDDIGFDRTEAFETKYIVKGDKAYKVVYKGKGGVNDDYIMVPNTEQDETYSFDIKVGN